MNNGNKNRNDSWQEGEYVDMWSFVHLLAGIVCGFVPIFLIFSFASSLTALVLVAFAWEYFEIKIGITENKKNSVVDILIATFGFISIYFVAVIGEFEKSLNLILLVIALCILTILTVWGWRAYFRRKARTKKI